MPPRLRLQRELSDAAEQVALGVLPLLEEQVEHAAVEARPPAVRAQRHRAVEPLERLVTVRVRVRGRGRVRVRGRVRMRVRVRVRVRVGVRVRVR